MVDYIPDGKKIVSPAYTSIYKAPSVILAR